MAQTGFTPIQLYSSSTPTNAPSAGNLTNDTKGSELAINIADGKLFYKDASNNVQTLADKTWLGTVTNVSALTLGTSGTDLSSTVANPTSTPVITLNVPTASAANRGALSSTDWSTFNNKQAALVSGTNIKTVNGTTLLGSGDLGTIGVGYGGTGTSTAFTTGSVVFAGASGVYSQNNASFFWDNTNSRLAIGTNSNPLNAKLVVRYSPATDNGLALLDNRAFAIDQGGSIGMGGVYNAGGSSRLFGAISAKKQNATDGNSQGYLAFSVNQAAASPAEVARIHSSGGMSLGNTTDPGAGVLFVSSGVRFPATQVASADANTLDDYEEGTWTPSFTSLTVAGASGSVTYAGRYTKIGRMVYFQVTVAASGGKTTASTWGATRHDLPFTPAQSNPTLAANNGGDASPLPDVGNIIASLTSNYTPTWSAYAGTIVISGQYEV